MKNAKKLITKFGKRTMLGIAGAVSVGIIASVSAYAATSDARNYKELEPGKDSIYYMVNEEQKSIDTKECKYEYMLDKYIDFSKVPDMDVEYKDKTMKLYEYSDLDFSKALREDVMKEDGYKSQDEIYKDFDNGLKEFYGGDIENLSKEQYLDFSMGQSDNYEDSKSLYFIQHCKDGQTLETLKIDCVTYLIAKKMKINEQSDDFKNYLATRFSHYTGPDMIKLSLDRCYDSLPDDLSGEEINYLLYQKSLLDYKTEILQQYVTKKEGIADADQMQQAANYYSYIYGINDLE